MTDYEIIRAAAIAEADNRTRAAGLPTYSELLDALDSLPAAPQTKEPTNDC